MKWFWILLFVAGVIYALTTDSAQGILQSDNMENAHDRATEIDDASVSTVPGGQNTSEE